MKTLKGTSIMTLGEPVQKPAPNFQVLRPRILVVGLNADT